MTNNPDPHPDDVAHRRAIFVELRRIREETGVLQKALGQRLGVTADNVRQIEFLAKPNPRLATVQRHARGLDHIAVPILHNIEPPPVTVYSRLLDDLTYSTKPALADAAFRALTMDRLVETRKARGLSVAKFTQMTGLNAGALFHLEAEDHETLLASYQRYARGLGSWLTIDLQPLEMVELGAAA